MQPYQYRYSCSTASFPVDPQESLTSSRAIDYVEQSGYTPSRSPIRFTSIHQHSLRANSPSRHLAVLDGHDRTADRSSNTWTSSSGELALLSEDERVDDRKHFVDEYVRLASKHGIRPLVRGDFPPTAMNGSVSLRSRRGSWVAKILRRTPSESSSHTKPRPMVVQQRRSISNIAMDLVHHQKKDGLKDKDLSALVRLCGKSLFYLPSEYAPCSLVLPTCFRALAQALVQQAGARGVFRVSGSLRVVNALYDYYCVDREANDVSSTTRCPSLPVHIKCGAHDVASAFKRLLAGLPGGILGSLALFDALVAIDSQLCVGPEPNRTKETKVRARLIALAIGTVRSQYQRELICAVFGLLCLVGRAAETAPREDDDGRPLPTADLIGYSALGIVFGPLLVGDLINSYNMKVADPSTGLVLFPVTPPRSRKERYKITKSRTEGSLSSSSVDKIRIANSIAEMLITHWRDIVRQMRSLGTLRSKPHSAVTEQRSRSSLRASASETFSLRKPPAWEHPRRGERSASPLAISPTRSSRTQPLKIETNFEDHPRSSSVPRRRSRPNSSSSANVLSRRHSAHMLSPTLEEITPVNSPTSNSSAHKLIGSSGQLERTNSHSRRQPYSSSPSKANVKARSRPTISDPVNTVRLDVTQTPRESNRDGHTEGPRYESCEGQTQLQHGQGQGKSKSSSDRCAINIRTRDVSTRHNEEASTLSWSPSLRSDERSDIRRRDGRGQATPPTAAATKFNSRLASTSISGEGSVGRIEPSPSSSSAPMRLVKGRDKQFNKTRQVDMPTKLPTEKILSPGSSPASTRSHSRCSEGTNHTNSLTQRVSISSGWHNMPQAAKLSRDLSKPHEEEQTNLTISHNTLYSKRTSNEGGKPSVTPEWKLQLSNRLQEDNRKPTSLSAERRSTIDGPAFFPSATKTSLGGAFSSNPPTKRTFGGPSRPVSQRSTSKPVSGAVKAMAALFDNAAKESPAGTRSTPVLTGRNHNGFKVHNSPHLQHATGGHSTAGTASSALASGAGYPSKMSQRALWDASPEESVTPTRALGLSTSVHYKNPHASGPSWNRSSEETPTRPRAHTAPRMSRMTFTAAKKEPQASSTSTKTTASDSGNRRSGDPTLDQHQETQQQQQASSLGTMVTPPEEPPVAQHIRFPRPSPSPSVRWHQSACSDLDRGASSPPSRSTSGGRNTVLLSQIRHLQRHLEARNEEIAQLRRQLEAREDYYRPAGTADEGSGGRKSVLLGVGELSEQLREARRGCRAWRERAEAAEKRVLVFERFMSRLKETGGETGRKTGQEQEQEKVGRDSSSSLSQHTEKQDVVNQRIRGRIVERMRRSGHGTDGTHEEEGGGSGKTVACPRRSSGPLRACQASGSDMADSDGAPSMAATIWISADELRTLQEELAAA